MKTKILALSLAAAVSSSAAIIVPGANGTDGVLNITADTEIDLSQAVNAAWDSDNTANASKGVYDATKWAVVFKYSSVNVAVGATLTFKNHETRAPVVWLVSGNVTISGTVKLDGQDGDSVLSSRLGEPGPGGFRGGSSDINGSQQANGAGFGLGGAPKNGTPITGAYGTLGRFGPPVAPPVYGNPSIVPLIGGSGGNGFDSWRNDRPFSSGGGGGGAILIACAGTISIDGEISARGGDYAVWVDDGSDGSGGGSGGGIRIACDVLSGTGQFSAKVGLSPGATGGDGRIRLERVTNTNTIAVTPAPSVVDLAAGTTAIIWPPTGAPEVRIVSIGGVNVTADPRSGFGTISADVSIPTTTTTPSVIETTNVEQASQVKVRITPRDTYNFTEVDATYASTVSASPLVIRWNATLPTNLGYSAVQVKVIRP